jgi:DNA end-binding protein Ku
VRFHQLDREDNQRIQQKRVNPRTGEEVPFENLVKGYELAPDRYVVISPEELDGLEPQKTRTIDIEDFVELSEIDPIYYDHPYYLVPDKGAGKAYKLLLDAMKESEKVAIARVVIRSKENLVAIRPLDGILTMETMLFADEVVPSDGIEDIPADGEATKTSARELEMAKQLIDSLTAEFEPDKYRDEYRERVLDMIERKAEGEEIVVEAPDEEPQKVPDLMAALEASIKGAKSQSEAPKKKAASSNGAKSGSRAKKKTTAKK